MTRLQVFYKVFYDADRNDGEYCVAEFSNYEFAEDYVKNANGEILKIYNAETGDEIKVIKDMGSIDLR